MILSGVLKNTFILGRNNLFQENFWLKLRIFVFQQILQFFQALLSPWRVWSFFYLCVCYAIEQFFLSISTQFLILSDRLLFCVSILSLKQQSCRFCDKTGQICEVNTVRGEGIEDADFIFYVSSTQTSRCNKGATVAYAAHCQQESAMDRPIAGHANLCPDSISTKPQDLETLLSTVKHEILHALGFSVSLYAYFRDKWVE